MNDNFGLPPEAEVKPQDEKTRIADLRAKAEAQAATEFNDDAVYEKLLVAARAQHMRKLLPENEVVLATDTSALPEEYDRVEIAVGRDANDLSYVPLGLDGLVIKAPRGVPIILPHLFVTECLDHAIEEVTIRSQGGLVTRPARRFPYTSQGKATKEEYQAYQAQQREQYRRDMAQAA